MTIKLHKPDYYFDKALLAQILAARGLSIDDHVMMLPEAGKVGGERRWLYFYQLLDANGCLSETANPNGNRSPAMRIIAFGQCNVTCPYCKRGLQFIDADGTVIESVSVPIVDVAAVCVGAVNAGEVVRFSGGDPVMAARYVLALAEFLQTAYGVKTSMAHNGSGTNWAKNMGQYLESAAIDLKAVPEKIGTIMGLPHPETQGTLFYDRSLATQAVLSHNGTLVDVRTPIFGDTSLEEMRQLAADIVQANDLNRTFWTWRLYKAVDGCDWAVPHQDRVIEMMTQISAEFPELWLGLRAKWEQSGMLYFHAGKIIR